MRMEQKAEGMLSPYRVLDLTNEMGFLCGKVLADLGADVIKIEKPGGDPARSIGPFYHDIPDPEKSLYWFAFNTSKRGITLDIETGDGQDIFKRLVKDADVVLESFAPGYMDKLDLGYSVLSQINPRLIMTSITGFGQSGPFKDYKAPNIVLWALSGNAYIHGDPDRAPLTPNFPICYLFGAMQGAIGTLIALYHCAATGQGQQVDVPTELYSVWPTGPEVHGLWDMERRIFKREGRRMARAQTDISTPLMYECKDGDVNFFPFVGPGMIKSVIALTEWIKSEGMANETLKQVDWNTFDWNYVTQDYVDEITDNFARFFRTRTKAELFEEAVKRGIMLYPSSTPKDLLEMPQLAAQLATREYWAQVEHAELNTTITYPGAFVKTAEAPYRIYCRAPLIGEHNVEVYTKELGLSIEELVTLKQSRVI